VHLVGFTIRIYHDARSSECQNSAIEVCASSSSVISWSDWKVFGNITCHCCTESYQI